MQQHPAIVDGNVAVITGGADGIGFAAATRFDALGLNVCLADNNVEKLQRAQSLLPRALSIATDVSQLADLESLQQQVYERYGRVDILMNNAGTGLPTSGWENYKNWQTTLNVNLWGVINGIQSFVPAMLEQNSPALIINTGSKQGITTPPGNPAYNASKAAIRSVTEALQHELRNTQDCQISAHLLVPGFTYTGMIQRFVDEKPAGAWTSEQVVEFMLESLGSGDFYILCPDNDTTREMDNKRMAWAMNDLIQSRPALSRWHGDYLADFKKYMDG